MIPTYSFYFATRKRTKSDKLRKKPSRCVWGMTVESNTSSNFVVSEFLQMPGMCQLREFHGYKDMVYDLLVWHIVQSCNLLRMFQGRCCFHLIPWRQMHYILPGKRQQAICLRGISIFRVDDWHHAPNSVICLLLSHFRKSNTSGSKNFILLISVH
jgi:hypothetical protein